MIGGTEKSAAWFIVSLFSVNNLGLVLNGCEAGGPDLTKLVTAVYERYWVANPLHSDVFPTARKMEAEVISMCLKSVLFFVPATPQP